MRYCTFTVAPWNCFTILCVYQFNRGFRALIKCEAPQQGSVLKSWSKANKPTRRTDNNLVFVAASVEHIEAPGASQSDKDLPSADSAKPPALSLVAHYNGSF